MSDTPHPSEAMLIAFGEGRLDDADIESVGDHLESCEQCQRSIDAIERRESSLIARLRGADGTLERLPADYEQKLLAIRVPVVDRVAADKRKENSNDGDGDSSPQFDPQGNTAVYRTPYEETQQNEEIQQSHKLNRSDPPVEVSRFSAGERFGDYEILAEINRGGMGVVYRARQITLNRTVALKMILDSRLASDESVQRFYAEATAAARLDHPGIVPVFDVGHVEGQHYFSMKLVTGGSLKDLLVKGPLPRRHAAQIVATVARAVQFAHSRNIIHRDLKPANVLLDQQGRPLITDFGLAKDFQSDSQLTSDGQVMGTPHYMAPEQAAGRSDEVGPLSDVYALGAILYRLVANVPPFQGNDVLETLHAVIHIDARSPREHNSEVDLDLATIGLKCLEKDPARRYPSAAELADDLDRYLRNEPIEARPVSRWERMDRWCQRNPRAVRSTLLAAIMMILAVISASIELDREVNSFEQTLDEVAQRSLQNTASWVADAAERELRQKFRDVRLAAVSPQLQQVLAKLVRDDTKYQLIKQELRAHDATALDLPVHQWPPVPGTLASLQGWIGTEERWEDTQNVLAWWVCGPDGYQIARDPWKPSLTRNFAFRSYFNGKNVDSSPGTIPEPIWQPGDGPRLSAVFRTRETDFWVLAISAPVFQDETLLGVVGVFLRLGSLLEDPGDGEVEDGQRFAVLLDPRGGNETAKIIEHPYHEHDHASQNGHLRQEVATTTITRNEWERPLGTDPFGQSEFRAKQEFGGRWRSAWAPVRIPDQRGQVLVAVVRESENLVAEPSRRLRINLRVLGLAVAGLLVLPPLIAVFLLPRQQARSSRI